MLVHPRVTSNIKFAGTHLYTWVERGTVRVKCLAQGHNILSPVRAWTQTMQSKSMYALTTRPQHLPLTCTCDKYIIWSLWSHLIATLFVDRGTEDYLNCKGRVDIINSTLGKALGGGAGMNEWIIAELPRAKGARAEPHTLEILVNPSSRENLVMTSPYERASERRPYRLWGRGRGVSR